MLPDGTLASVATVSGFHYPVKTPLPDDKLQDWELAGRYLNYPDEGLLVKVWHLRAVYDRVANTVRVILFAPGGVSPTEASRELFNYPNITEVALSFDQNMNPFVAYMKGAEAWIYWYDGTVPGMVHTMLPAGCTDLRCTLDERRDFAILESDIVLSYLRAENLCVRYQRDRYTVEYILRTNVGENCRLVSMARNSGNRLQWRLRFYERTDDAGALFQNNPYLADVVEQICIKAGIPRESINVSDLYNDFVPGLKVTSDEGLDAPLKWLQEVFFFDKAEFDKQIKFVKRGGPVIRRIPYKDLVQGTPTALSQVMDDQKKLPRVATVTHIDPNGGYAANTQRAERRSNLIQSDARVTVDTQVVLSANQAATAATTTLKMGYNELITYEFSTTLRHSDLTVTDVVEVEDEEGNWHRMRLTERNEDTGIIEWVGRQDGGKIYNNPKLGNELPTPLSTTPGLVGETLFEIIDCSPLYDQDDELGLYVAACGEPDAAWNGCQLLMSVDSGISYVEVQEITAPATIGETLSGLTAEAGFNITSAQTVEVLVQYPLTSVAPTQINYGANRCCIGSEIMQFETATLLGMVGSLYRYELDNLHRAKYGEPASVWPTGTRFVLLDEGVIFIRAQRSMIGLELEFKPVTFGQTLDETTVTSYDFNTPASQTEWTPINITVLRDGGTNDVGVGFDGRPRLGQFGTPFNSKYFTGYKVKFSNGHEIVTTSDYVIYSAAPTGITVQVCATNSITGDGPYSAPVAT